MKSNIPDDIKKAGASSEQVIAEIQRGIYAAQQSIPQMELSFVSAISFAETLREHADQFEEEARRGVEADFDEDDVEVLKETVQNFMDRFSEVQSEESDSHGIEGVSDE